MYHKVTISIDVENINVALDFYTKALGCEFKRKYSDLWQIINSGGTDIHLQEKKSGTIAAGDRKREYTRHWTPVHLDFVVKDIKPICEAIQEMGGIVEDTAFSANADIAHCADPFGNGFCIIRE